MTSGKTIINNNNPTRLIAVTKSDKLLVRLKRKQLRALQYHEEKILSNESLKVLPFQCPLPNQSDIPLGLVLSLCLPFVMYSDLDAVTAVCRLSLSITAESALKNTVDTMYVHKKVRMGLENLQRECEFTHREVLKYFDMCVDPGKEVADLHFPEWCFRPPSWGTEILGPNFAPIDASNPHTFIYGLFESDTYQNYRICLLPGPESPGKEQVGRFVFYIGNDEAYTGTWRVASENGKPVISWQGEVRGAVRGQFHLDWNVEREAFDLKHNSEILYRRTECLANVNIKLKPLPWVRAAQVAKATQHFDALTAREGCCVYLDEATQRLKYRVLHQRRPRSEKPSYAVPPSISPRARRERTSESSRFWSHYPRKENEIQEQKELRTLKFSKKLSKRSSGERGHGKGGRNANQRTKKRHQNSKSNRARHRGSSRANRKYRTRSQRHRGLVA